MESDSKYPDAFFTRKPLPKGFNRRRMVVGLAIILPVLILTSLSFPSPQVQDTLQAPYSKIDFQHELMLHTSPLVSISDIPHSPFMDSLADQARRFYADRDFMPVWTTDSYTKHPLGVLINLLDSANYFGFPFDYFGREMIDSLRGEFNSSKSLVSRVNIEIAATHSAFMFMYFLRQGIIQADSVCIDTDFIRILPRVLANALHNGNLRDSILAFQPNLIQYRRIISSLPHYIDLSQSVRYTTPKFIDERVLARSLFYAGVGQGLEVDTFINNHAALHRLQERFNLPKDTLLNHDTHAALVWMLDYRYYQACLNLNRLRNVQGNDESYLFVNIPEFRLHVVERNQQKEVYNVIVGRTDTPTPVFSSTIQKVVTNPHWTVPRSIANRDIIHRIRQDSTYLAKNGYTVINYREEPIDPSIIDWNGCDPLGYQHSLRQLSGSQNALGTLKIMFPNEHSVYIHDTPSRALFSQKYRTFSAGCIRLENPARLAQYLTDRYNASSNVNIMRIIDSKESKDIPLLQQVRIHIQYITCTGNPNDELEFYSDIYNLDRLGIKELFPEALGEMASIAG